MRALGRGVIVNICGTAGNQIPADYAAGITANGALITLTRALGGTSLNHGIRVLGINPGDMENERGIMFLRRQAEKEFGDAERWREMYSDLPGGSAAGGRPGAPPCRGVANAGAGGLGLARGAPQSRIGC